MSHQADVINEVEFYYLAPSFTTSFCQILTIIRYLYYNYRDSYWLTRDLKIMSLK